MYSGSKKFQLYQIRVLEPKNLLGFMGCSELDEFAAQLLSNVAPKKFNPPLSLSWRLDTGRLLGVLGTPDITTCIDRHLRFDPYSGLWCSRVSRSIN